MIKERMLQMYVHELQEEKVLAENELKRMTDVNKYLNPEHKEWVQVDNFFDAMRIFRKAECYEDFAREILPVVKAAWQRQCDKKREIINDIQKQIDEL